MYPTWYSAQLKQNPWDVLLRKGAHLLIDCVAYCWFTENWLDIIKVDIILLFKFGWCVAFLEPICLVNLCHGYTLPQPTMIKSNSSKTNLFCTCLKQATQFCEFLPTSGCSNVVRKRYSIKTAFNIHTVFGLGSNICKMNLRAAVENQGGQEKSALCICTSPQKIDLRYLHARIRTAPICNKCEQRFIFRGTHQKKIQSKNSGRDDPDFFCTFLYKVTRLDSSNGK